MAAILGAIETAVVGWVADWVIAIVALGAAGATATWDTGGVAWLTGGVKLWKTEGVLENIKEDWPKEVAENKGEAWVDGVWLVIGAAERNEGDWPKADVANEDADWEKMLVVVWGIFWDEEETKGNVELDWGATGTLEIEGWPKEGWAVVGSRGAEPCVATCKVQTALQLHLLKYIKYCTSKLVLSNTFGRN